MFSAGCDEKMDLMLIHGVGVYMVWSFNRGV